MKLKKKNRNKEINFDIFVLKLIRSILKCRYAMWKKRKRALKKKNTEKKGEKVAFAAVI